MRERFVPMLKTLSKPSVSLSGAGVIALVAVGFALTTVSVVPTGAVATAAYAPITADGGASSDLSFQVSGQVVAIPVTLGQTVAAGTVLVALDRASLEAARAGAAANLEAAEARLAALEFGTRPEQLAIDQTAVTQTQHALTGAIQTAYATADDAVHTKADQVFINPRSDSATLAILVSDAVLANRLQAERIALEPLFSSWSAALSVAPDAAASEANLRTVAVFLDDLTTALAEAQPSGTISASAISGYQTSVNAGRLSVLATLSALIGADTAHKTAVGALALAEAGATAQDIAAQNAVVDSARAALSAADASLQKAMLRAPFAGTVTAMNARLGQTVFPGQVLVSIEPSGGSVSKALVVPASSVITDGAQAFVYVKPASGAPVKTPVTTGITSAAGMTQITSGLSEGDAVLTFGTANAH